MSMSTAPTSLIQFEHSDSQILRRSRDLVALQAGPQCNRLQARSETRIYFGECNRVSVKSTRSTYTNTMLALEYSTQLDTHSRYRRVLLAAQSGSDQPLIFHVSTQAQARWPFPTYSAERQTVQAYLLK